MKHFGKIRFLALLLALVMVAGMVPMSAFATETEQETQPEESATVETVEDATEEISEEETAEAETEGEPVAQIEESEEYTFADFGMTVISDKESTLAPGVAMNEVVVYNESGSRVEMYITTTDLTVETAHIYANYKDNQCQVFGMSKLTEQVTAAEANHAEPYTVVAGINASYYNMTTGAPTGAFVMEGVDASTSGDSYSFFAILKDGTAFIGGKGEYSVMKDQIQEAIGGYIHLVEDGEICSGLNDTTLYPRQTVGVTADGRVITMTADGNQAPASVGLTVQEQAELMLALGCVEAVHLDGGGSCTFGAKAEGSDSFEILNSPSDGSERSISNSLIIVSTAVADGTFDHAALSAEHDYVTPGSTVSVSATGVDAAGGSAEIPADVSWQLADSTLGTVENGVFTSNGTAGDAVIQMVYGGSVVGEVTVHVVIPEKLTFDSAQITIPYTKSVTLGLTATYGVNEVVMKDGDVIFTLENEAAGSVDGFVFTACEENAEVTGTAISAVLAFDSSVTASTEIVLGKGSEVLFDFEDGTDGGLYLADTSYNYVWPESEAYIVNASTGKVHSGENALALKIDYTNSLESGYQRMILRATEAAVFENATSIGMWIYIPDEAVGLWARWGISSVTVDEDGNVTYGATITGQDIDGATGGTGVVYSFQESGWHYLSMDTSAYSAIGWQAGAQLVQFYISDRDGAAFDYYFKNVSNVNGDFTFYVDDITVDYSSAVDDRNAPVFSSVVYANGAMADAVELNGQTSTDNTLSFTATVAEYAASNATGIDASTAKAHVDGKEVSCEYAGGKIAIEGIVLADGQHTVKFSVCDNMGNYASVIRTIIVEAGSGLSTIKVVPHDDTLDRILLGSVYYVDIVATDVEKVNTVTTTLDLDNMSVWNLEHMEVLAGFEASYSIVADENIATVTITRTGTVSATGEVVLVSLPIRTWELKMGYTYTNGTKAGSTAYTYAQYRSMKEFWPVAIILEVDKGVVTFTDGTVSTFSGAGVQVDTEMWANYGNMTGTTEGLAYFNAWDGGHIHTADAMEDKAAACTEAGYTGRTYCEECASVVDWGTTIPATGHGYDFVDGVLQCSCGELFTGVHSDGKVYVDGVIITDGWVNGSYYVDGVALTGIQLVDGYYYDFGEDGVSTGKYTGLFEMDGQLYYAVVGTRMTGWIYEDGAYYYFNPSTYAAVNGTVKIAGYTYEFVDNQLYNGHWVYNSDGSIEYVWAGTKLCSQWFTLRENTYYFNNNCKLATGVSIIKLSTGGDSQFFVFDENGVFIEAVTYTGCYEYNGATYFLIEGVLQTGIQEENGIFYYFRSNYQMYEGTYRYVDDNAANGYVTEGYCWFDVEDHHLLNNEFADPDGDGVESYYVMGRVASGGQWIQENGKTYYLNSSGTPVKGSTWVDGVFYYFDTEDGHLCDYEFIIRNDTMYYCIGGQIQYLGLVEIDGETYYISTNSGRVMRNCGYWVSGDKNPTGVDQLYYFDENGCRRDEEFFTIDGVLYYMIDGQTAKLGLFEVDGSLYYASTNSGTIKTGKYYVESKNANGYTGDCYYYFGEDGKALNEVFYTDVDGSLYYLVNGLPCKDGLVLIDGSYYYLSTNSGAAKCGVRYYVEAKNTNGLLEAGWYYFGEDGKLVF